MESYESLEQEFDAKVAKLQAECSHDVSQWMEHWWAIGHSSGYQVLVCNRCKKTLKENPTKEERDKVRQERLREWGKHENVR